MRPGKVLAPLVRRTAAGLQGTGARPTVRAGAGRTVVRNRMMDLKGQVALVTGRIEGIGRSIALALGDRGATVVGTATTEAGAPNHHGRISRRRGFRVRERSSTSG